MTRCPYCGKEIPAEEFAKHHAECEKRKLKKAEPSIGFAIRLRFGGRKETNCFMLGAAITKEINRLITYLEGLKEIPPTERIIPIGIRNDIQTMVDIISGTDCLTEIKKREVLLQLENALHYLDKEDLDGLLASLHYTTNSISPSLGAFL